jgi:formylglycine-generating enzyme required for sulfatase activity
MCSGILWDEDQDGYASNACGADDCDDTNANVYPGAPELCDGIDNQCPGDPGYGEVDGTCGPMVQIPAGCFNMGDAFSEGNAEELPVHNVCISAFEMDVHEVTNDEYKQCVDEGACTPPPSGGDGWRDPAYRDFPAGCVDWNQAEDYCAWDGKRLPTEAEWEYAARGGLAGKRYPWGDTISGADANFRRSGDPWEVSTSPVGYYPANGYGLYDMAGNAWEWVKDNHSSTYYQYCVDQGIVNDPPGPESTWSKARVVRSGSAWNHMHADGTVPQLRVAYRVRKGESFPIWCSGFRCARGGAYGP